MIQDTLLTIYSNKVLMVGIFSWAIGQILKFIIYAITHKKIEFSRLVGDGGMPSCHSATVTSMAIMSGLVYGLQSFEFAIASMLAIIVMHDAMGVRLETGKQAKVINQLSEIITKFENLTIDFSETNLKEFVGHTPLQVIMGSLLGIIVAFSLYNIWV